MVSHKSGETLHGLVRNISALIWQTTTSTFVEYEAVNKADYAIAIPEIFKSGSSGGSLYAGDFPVGITTSDRYFVQWLDANDVEHYFGWIDWTGSEEDFATLRNRIR